MKKSLFLALAAALAAANARAGQTNDLSRFFGADWARAADLAPGTDGPLSQTHAPVAHMYITLKAFEMYSARYDSTELARYMGGSQDSKPDSDKGDTVVEGSYEEDSPYKNPWNEMIPELRHFWDRRIGPTAGYDGNDSSVNRTQKYFTGGYGLDGQYDDGWGNSGTQDMGIFGLYKSGDKAKAFYYLGHAAHLLEDLTVPAHALLFPHPFNGDAYESFMKEHHADAEWAAVPAGPVESFATVFDIFDRTGDVTNDFDAGRSESSGADGKKDMGARRARGFTDADLREEGDVLMPLAYKRVAALFLYFFKQVDHVPPQVETTFPRSADASTPDRVEGLRVTLHARATDASSGADRRGYRFEYALWTGDAWSSWSQAASAPTPSELDFDLLPGRRYAIRVSAVDAAGNRALSAVKYLTTEPAIAAN